MALDEHNDLTTKTKRLKYFRQALEFKKAQMGRLIGVKGLDDSSNYNRLEAGEEVSGYYETSILEAFPNLNPVWWETGQGDMLSEGTLTEERKRLLAKDKLIIQHKGVGNQINYTETSPVNTPNNNESEVIRLRLENQMLRDQVVAYKEMLRKK